MRPRRRRERARDVPRTLARSRANLYDRANASEALVQADVRLVCIPSTDVDFADHARATLRSLGARVDEGTRHELEARLRRLYPGAEVRRRADLATYGSGDDVVWYALNRTFSTAIREAIELSVPREEVFDAYVGRYPEWQSAVEVHPVDATLGAYATYAATYEIFGRRFDGRFDLVEVDRPRLVRVEARGGSGIEVWYVTSFREVAGGTRVEVVGDYELPSRLLPEVQRFIVDRVIARDIRRAHQSLADLLDQAPRAARRPTGVGP
jgi:hypothetical protein